MPRVKTDKVIAFYFNPNGKVEKHEMTTVNFEEASRPKILQNDRGRPYKHVHGEEHLWIRADENGNLPQSHSKGVKVEEIIDFTPQPFDVKAMDSAPPPALQRDSLRERSLARG